ncbi:hypothetical protein [Rhodococcus sp. NPDC058639]|uniref:hypothetical protein n=1 Tax=Rhodococcus sp. NPDC058639 TaxID=3346570 RepID=UPI003667AB40
MCARTIYYGRRLIIDRYRDGWSKRSSRTHTMLTRTPVEVEARIVALRVRERRGPDWLAAELDVPARAIARVLRRHDVPYLTDCDPLTEEVIRGVEDDHGAL